MSDQKTTETVRAVDKTASTGGSTVDKKADTARTVTSAGADVAQQGAERLPGQTNDIQEMIRRASQDAAQRTSENLELMKRWLKRWRRASVRPHLKWWNGLNRPPNSNKRPHVKLFRRVALMRYSTRKTATSGKICRHCSTSVPRYSTAQPTRLARRATNCRRRISGKLEAVHAGEVDH